MSEEIKVGEYVSKNDFLKKEDSIVAYALYVQDNIKRDDYARLNTGRIVKVMYIKENNCNKKAIYYGIYDTDWFDCSAVENFSKNIIDLIEVGDYVNGYEVELSRYDELYIGYVYCGGIGQRTTEAYATFIKDMKVEDIKSIVTKEQFAEMEYKVNE